MKLAEIKNGLAAMHYYQSPECNKEIQFEHLPADSQAVFLSLAESVIVNLDKLNLALVPKSTKNQAEVEAMLRDKIEAAVRDFIKGLHKSHKPAGIPQEELVARIMQVWKSF